MSAAKLFFELENFSSVYWLFDPGQYEQEGTGETVSLDGTQELPNGPTPKMVAERIRLLLASDENTVIDMMKEGLV